MTKNEIRKYSIYIFEKCIENILDGNSTLFYDFVSQTINDDLETLDSVAEKLPYIEAKDEIFQRVTNLFREDYQ